MAVDPKLSKKMAKVVVTDIVDRWKTWKGGGENGRLSKEEKWAECDRAFKSQHPDNTDVDEFRSRRYMPEGFKAAVNFVSTASQGIFPNESAVMARGMSADAAQNEVLRTHYMRNRLEGNNFQRKFSYNHLLPLAVFGNSPYITEWDYTVSRRRSRKWGANGQERSGPKPYTYTVEVPVLDPATGATLGMEKVEKTYNPLSFVYDGPSFRPLDLFNFVIDPTNSNQHSAIKIYRYFLPKTELMKRTGKNADGYALYNEKAVKELMDEDAQTETEQSDSTARQRSQLYGTQNVPSGGAKHAKDMVEMFYITGDLPVDGGMLEGYVFEIGNRKHLLRGEPEVYDCGLSSMRLATLLPVPGETYGFGILENSLGLIDGNNVFYNQIFDAVALELNGIKIVKDNGATDLDNLVAAPGAVWVEENTGDIRPFPSQIGTVLQGLGLTNNLARQIVDATYSTISFGAVKNETATATAVAANLAESATGFLVRNVEADIERHILPFFDEVEKQYWDKDNDVYARFQDESGTQFERVTEDVIYQDYEWKTAGSAAAQTKSLKVQETIGVLSALAQTPAASSVDFEQAGKELLTMIGVRNVETLVPGFAAMAQKPGSLAAQISTGLAGGAEGQGGQGAPGTPGNAPPGRGAIPNAGGSPQLAEAGRRGGGLQGPPGSQGG